MSRPTCALSGIPALWLRIAAISKLSDTWVLSTLPRDAHVDEYSRFAWYDGSDESPDPVLDRLTAIDEAQGENDPRDRTIRLGRAATRLAYVDARFWLWSRGLAFPLAPSLDPTAWLASLRAAGLGAQALAERAIPLAAARKLHGPGLLHRPLALSLLAHQPPWKTGFDGVSRLTGDGDDAWLPQRPGLLALVRPKKYEPDLSIARLPEARPLWEALALAYTSGSEPRTLAEYTEFVEAVEVLLAGERGATG